MTQRLLHPALTSLVCRLTRSSATSAGEDTVEKKCCWHQSDLRPAAALCLLMARRVRHGAQLPPLVRIQPE